MCMGASMQGCYVFETRISGIRAFICAEEGTESRGRI